MIDYYAANYQSPVEVNPTIASAESMVVPSTQKANVPWYQNPGVWSKIGAVGSALLPNNSTFRGFKEAGAYAANYHQAQQLDRTQKKMFANIAAGADPMEGIDSSWTQGLSPEQTMAVNKEGMDRAHQAREETNRDLLTQNTLATGQTYRDYTEQLTKKVEDELQQEELFKQHITDVAEGKVKSKYITPENVEYFKAAGPKKSNEIISEIVKQEEIAKRQGIKTEQVNLGDRIVLVNSQTGLPIQQWTVGQKPAGAGSLKPSAAIITKAENHAFQEMLPEMEKAWMQSLGKDAAAAQKFKDLKKLIGSADPLVAANARSQLISLTPDITNAYRLRVNDITESITSGKGIPPVKGADKAPVDKKILGPDGTPLPPPKPEELDKLVRELTKNGKVPTVEEVRNAYVKKFGNKGAK